MIKSTAKDDIEDVYADIDVQRKVVKRCEERIQKLTEFDAEAALRLKTVRRRQDESLFSQSVRPLHFIYNSSYSCIGIH